MIKKQIWRPDTCGCAIEQTFDYSTDPATLVGGEVVERCKEHESDTHEVIMLENQTKNRVLGEILNLHTELQEATEEGGVTFKKGLIPEWSYGKNRELIIKLPAVIADKVDDTQDVLDAKFENVSIE